MGARIPSNFWHPQGQGQDIQQIAQIKPPDSL